MNHCSCPGSCQPAAPGAGSRRRLTGSGAVRVDEDYPTMMTVRLATAAAATLGAVEPNALRQALIDREPAAARAPESIELVRGPGRVNLIGEHTDYNEGFVLPAAIGLQIAMALIPTTIGGFASTSLRRARWASSTSTTCRAQRKRDRLRGRRRLVAGGGGPAAAWRSCRPRQRSPRLCRIVVVGRPGARGRLGTPHARGRPRRQPTGCGSPSWPSGRRTTTSACAAG